MNIITVLKARSVRVPREQSYFYEAHLPFLMALTFVLTTSKAAGVPAQTKAVAPTYHQ